MSTAGMCRPNGDLNEETGTAFVAKTPNGNYIVLSALHCFLEDQEEKDAEEVGGVAIEEALARPASRRVNKKSEIALQSDNPEELKRIIQASHDRLLRDRVLHYYYWFHYKESGQHVPLMGKDFVADFRVEYSVVSM